MGSKNEAFLHTSANSRLFVRSVSLFQVLLADQFRKFFAWETPSDCQWQATDFSEEDLWTASIFQLARQPTGILVA
jgi:hypothetical protein